MPSSSPGCRDSRRLFWYAFIIADCCNDALRLSYDCCHVRFFAVHDHQEMFSNSCTRLGAKELFACLFFTFTTNMAMAVSSLLLVLFSADSATPPAPSCDTSGALLLHAWRPSAARLTPLCCMPGAIPRHDTAFFPPRCTFYERLSHLALSGDVVKGWPRVRQFR